MLERQRQSNFYSGVLNTQKTTSFSGMTKVLEEQGTTLLKAGQRRLTAAAVDESPQAAFFNTIASFTLIPHCATLFQP